MDQVYSTDSETFQYKCEYEAFQELDDDDCLEAGREIYVGESVYPKSHRFYNAINIIEIAE